MVRWLRVGAGFVLVAVMTGCAHGNSVQSVEQSGPDMGGVLRIGTKRSWAHACPISETLALTAGHVVDPLPLDTTAPLLAGRWSDAYGGRGFFFPVREGISQARDIAIIEIIEGKFSKWFPIAKQAPFEGQPLYILGFDWRRGADAFSPRRHKVRFQREEAGRLVLSAQSEAGSSGGCVLTADGEVVGIVESRWYMEDGESVGAAVAVYGESCTE